MKSISTTFGWRYGAHRAHSSVWGCCARRWGAGWRRAFDSRFTCVQRRAARRQVGRARAVPREIQKKRYNAFESRRIWKLAAVLAERDKLMYVASEKAAKDLKDQQAIVRAYTETMARETERLKAEAIAEEKVTKAVIKENELLQDRRTVFEETEQVRGPPQPLRCSAAAWIECRPAKSSSLSTGAATLTPRRRDHRS